jgi:4-hydroxy-3-polyprenylbenzoate decarboxylase
MSYSGTSHFIDILEKKGELQRIKTFVNPVLEIAEITDRVTKSGGKALLFENNGTAFPLLINAFGSDGRLAAALGKESLMQAGDEIEKLFNQLMENRGNLIEKIAGLPKLLKVAGFFPSLLRKKGICQQVVHKNPDLGILPVLKCWPYDGGRFITLPMVHTINPVSLKPNVGMYRMQILGSNITAMHWQRHKTGAAHYREWKKIKKRMPVSVSLGGDPVYTYAATAPLPENIDEFILAGFLRGRSVKMVKCLTNDLYVPFDADIIIEGYIDPDEELVWEGPFGDHTGFYSLADWYPRFHVTCITHSEKAVYPSTIVGIPPHEDSWLIKATEKIFLKPIKLTLQPEIVDFHMPEAGVAHNLVIVKINKEYPGQGMKVINSLFGTGQLMFTKYLIVVSGNVDIRSYSDVMNHFLKNTDFSSDISFTRGPLDVLDHASDAPSFGGKAGIDATVKLPEETTTDIPVSASAPNEVFSCLNDLIEKNIVKSYNESAAALNIPLLILAVATKENTDAVDVLKESLIEAGAGEIFRIILLVDHQVDVNDYYTVAWQVLGNSDPLRDHVYLSPSSILVDGTIKIFRKGGFPRRWPNIVCSDTETILSIDKKWHSLGLGDFVSSPSLKAKKLIHKGTDEIIVSMT